MIVYNNIVEGIYSKKVHLLYSSLEDSSYADKMIGIIDRLPKSSVYDLYAYLLCKRSLSLDEKIQLNYISTKYAKELFRATNLGIIKCTSV